MNSMLLSTTAKRLLPALLVACALVWLCEFVIHSVWVLPVARAWGAGGLRGPHVGWLLGGQFVIAAVFVLVWARWFAGRASVGLGVAVGVCMGLFCQALSLVCRAVSPLSLGVVGEWAVAGTLEGLVLGVVIFGAARGLRRRWVLRVALAVVPTVVLLGGAELALRAAHWFLPNVNHDAHEGNPVVSVPFPAAPRVPRWRGVRSIR